MVFAPRCDTIAIRDRDFLATRIALFRINEAKGEIESATPFDQGDLNDSFHGRAPRSLAAAWDAAARLRDAG
jgi:hypothetical protein